MKRACYTKQNDGYHAEHIRSINSDGTVTIEAIPELSVGFDTLIDLFMNANRNGYGIIGSSEDIITRNRIRAYDVKCGNNQMDIDEL